MALYCVSHYKLSGHLRQVEYFTIDYFSSRHETTKLTRHDAPTSPKTS